MRLLIPFVVLLSTAPALQAQTTPAIPPGARVRIAVSQPDPRLEIGAYQGITDRTLRLLADRSTDGVAMAIPLASVSRLETSRGRQRSVVGGIVGFALGAAAGGTLGCLANRDSYGVFCGGQSDTRVIGGALLGGAAGALAGALLFRRERWAPVQVPQPAR